MDVSIWLRDLGLEDYAQAFQANHIDAEVLPRLTADDLTRLGITSLGHRRKLLDAIAALDRGWAPAGAEAERRQLTVLFCDLVGSTELAARIDPEDLRGVMGAYHRCTAAVVERFQGHVAKYLGDGVLAYFGWPQAHEDDAERAVRAGLALVGAVAELEPYAEARLQARVGIATGQVVVGDVVGEGAARDVAVVGSTPNLAARLQAAAQPGTVVISQATRRLLGRLFELVDLGARRLQGFAEPLPAWRVEGEGRAEDRFEALHGEHLTPLVGREHELSILLERWVWAKDSRGQVVLLSGEPGIGKSRVIRALRERLGDELYTPLSHCCSPYHTNSAFHPVIELLERATQLGRDEPPEAQLAKLETVLRRSSNRLNEVVPLLAALLGVPTGERYTGPLLSPEMQKRRTLQALVDQLAGLAAQQPVLAVYEDAHWIDASTLELLDLVVERIERLPVLVLITFRPEFQPPWTGQAHVTSLSMSRLDLRQGADLVARVTGDKPLPAAIIEQIVARTDGVPLFIEELTKTVLESGLLIDAGDRYELSGPLPQLTIPTTLHDSLMARLDRLTPVKEVAQIGAVIGREFSHELLAAVAPMSKNLLGDALERLVSSELLFRRGTPPEASYSFKHALVQDAAYGTLLKPRRQELHARIAQVLEEQSPGKRETQPELLAYHCTNGGLIEKAVDYWYRAGRQTLARPAMVEAAAQLTQALDLLAGLPPGPDRDQKEFDLLIPLGAALIATKGWVPEVERVYARAGELCTDKDQKQQFLSALQNLFQNYLLCSSKEAARQIARELLSLAERQQEDGAQVLGHTCLAVSLLFNGQLGPARTHCERALALYDPAYSDSPVKWAGPNTRVACLLCRALILLLQGYQEQSLVCSQEARDAAYELSHPLMKREALYLIGWFHQVRREQRAVEERTRVLIPLAVEHCLSALAMGVQQHTPGFLALLAELYLGTKKSGQALPELDEALARVDRLEERWFEAELWRLKGQALLGLTTDHSAEAETCHQHALKVARDQGARLWELRAATSLARLWAHHGKRSRAHDLLAPIYGWFTEGFDTADLKDAKALLDELA
jgi:class 3 adenylate cyclase/DNA polymerase III delta prime subunit